jgi:hypothetical protein
MYAGSEGVEAAQLVLVLLPPHSRLHLAEPLTAAMQQNNSSFVLLHLSHLSPDHTCHLIEPDDIVKKKDV